MIKESQREPNQASFREVVAAGDYFIHTLKQGQTVRLLDLDGNQAADTLSTAPLIRQNATAPWTPSANRAMSTSPPAPR